MRKVFRVSLVWLLFMFGSIAFTNLIAANTIFALKVGCSVHDVTPCFQRNEATTNPSPTPIPNGPKCGNVTVSFNVGCSGTGNPIYDYLRSIIKFMSGIFGIVAVLMVIASGFQYMTSAGNPEAVKNAKKRLGNVILSIILFVMMFGILSYIIPGGVL